jgi:hypothetical protein
LICLLFASGCGADSADTDGNPVVAEQALSSVGGQASWPAGDTIIPQPSAPEATLTPIPSRAIKVTAGQQGQNVQLGSASLSGPTSSIGTAALQAAQQGVPACTAQAENSSGGPVISNPRISLFFYGSWDAGTASSYASPWPTLSVTPAFWKRLSEYGIGNGSFGQRLPDYVTGIGSPSDCALLGQLAAALGSAGVVPEASPHMKPSSSRETS